MPTKSGKKNQGPSLYKTFVDAYMKARPDVQRAVSEDFSSFLKSMISL
jgi:hypothetical protein